MVSLSADADAIGSSYDDLGSGDVPVRPIWPPSAPPNAFAARDDMIGFVLVVLASAGICLSLNLQKMVHVRNTDPVTGQPMANFVTLPLWWVGSLLNAASELLNLAALGYAPATLVTPLGCLTVVFNAVAAVVFLGEPFFKRDLAGIVLIGGGVICVVLSQARARAVSAARTARSTASLSDSLSSRFVCIFTHSTHAHTHRG